MPISMAPVSESTPAGTAVLGQIMHGHVPGAGPVVNVHVKSAAMALPATSFTTAAPSPVPAPPRTFAVNVVRYGRFAAVGSSVAVRLAAS